MSVKVIDTVTNKDQPKEVTLEIISFDISSCDSVGKWEPKYVKELPGTSNIPSAFVTSEYTGPRAITIFVKGKYKNYCKILFETNYKNGTKTRSECSLLIKDSSNIEYVISDSDTVKEATEHITKTSNFPFSSCVYETNVVESKYNRY